MYIIRCLSEPPHDNAANRHLSLGLEQHHGASDWQSPKYNEVKARRIDARHHGASSDQQLRPLSAAGGRGREEGGGGNSGGTAGYVSLGTVSLPLSLSGAQAVQQLLSPGIYNMAGKTSRSVQPGQRDLGDRGRGA